MNGKQDHVVVPEQRDVKSVNNTPRFDFLLFEEEKLLLFIFVFCLQDG